jgi:aerobic-type carbon monoxide dehydrogenase small subunit (CoxS/CutS family)
MKRSAIRPLIPEGSEDPGVEVALTVNGQKVRRTVSVRLLLSDFLRHELGLTGTHVGCEHGVCGCCTVHIDGKAGRSCLTLALQANGCNIRTSIRFNKRSRNATPCSAAFARPAW